MLTPRSLVAIVLVVMLSGCAFKNNPIPLGDSELVGLWLHDGVKRVEEGELHSRMAVGITAAGYISYHFLSCLTAASQLDPAPSAGVQTLKSKSLHLINMPIIRATIKKIKAQTFPLTPKWEFNINQWPSRQEGKWQMVMDNTLLIRIATGGVVKDKPVEKTDSKQWQCEG
ncbi:MAG: hypothetical protein COA99_07590 [Moraxellaceae bacterium]|nr:MAG: hypothetical protein COA99_07590 [Moraxellaceae bacterium]